MTRQHIRTAFNRAAPALITLFMLLWIIFGAVMNAGAGDFPRGF